MHVSRILFTAILALTLFASCNRDEAAIRARAQKLVDRHAAIGEAEFEFGTAADTYTQEEALTNLQKTPATDKAAHDRWQYLTEHPRTLHFTPGGKRQLYLFLDDANKVTGYYITSQ